MNNGSAITSSSRIRKVVKKVGGFWRPLLLLGIIASLLASMHLFGFDARLRDSEQWLDSFGAWRPVVYTLVFIVTTIAVVPHWIPTVLAGMLFNEFAAIVVASIGSTVGAGLAFLISRHLARKPVMMWLGRRSRFRKIERLTRDHGAIIVLFMRLLPFAPYNVLNYGFGLTAVRFRTYVFWSWLGMLPCTVMYISGASVGTRLLNGEFHWPLIIFAAASIVAAGILMIAVRRKMAVHREEMNDNSDACS